MKITQEKVIKTFIELSRATSIKGVDDILMRLKIDKKYHINESKYPKLNLSITSAEIKKLIKQENIINKDYGINDVSNESALTKLLYAFLWKQGDIAKIKHIIAGILSTEPISESGLILYHFGKHLTANNEPIVDQHVLRAWVIYANHIESTDTKKTKPKLISGYKNWLNNNLSESLKKEANYLYHIDKLMYAIGKSIK